MHNVKDLLQIIEEQGNFRARFYHLTTFLSQKTVPKSVVYWKKVFILFISNVDRQYSPKRYHIKKRKYNLRFLHRLSVISGWYFQNHCTSKIILPEDEEEEEIKNNPYNNKLFYNNWNIIVFFWIVQNSNKKLLRFT